MFTDRRPAAGTGLVGRPVTIAHAVEQLEFASCVANEVLFSPAGRFSCAAPTPAAVVAPAFQSCGRDLSPERLKTTRDAAANFSISASVRAREHLLHTLKNATYWPYCATKCQRVTPAARPPAACPQAVRVSRPAHARPLTHIPAHALWDGRETAPASMAARHSASHIIRLIISTRLGG